MTTVFHVVGVSGVGRSDLSHALAAQYEARGFRCEVCEMVNQLFRDDAVAMWPHAAFIFLEYRPGTMFKTEPGDIVVRIERAANDSAPTPEWPHPSGRPLLDFELVNKPEPAKAEEASHG